MKRFALCLILAASGCKPPPGDAALVREMPEAEPVFASAPLPSPDVEGAIWVSSQTAGRIIYGVPQRPALMALECRDDAGEAMIEITRMAPADKGAQALLALVGNGAIGRIEVDAVELGKSRHWRGRVAASDRNIEPLIGPRKVTATVPGAGMVELNASPRPGQLIAACARPSPGTPETEAPDVEAPELEPVPELEIMAEVEPEPPEPAGPPQPDLPEPDSPEPSPPEDPE